MLFGRSPQPYLLIVDDIQTEMGAKNDFTWLLHTNKKNKIEVASEPGKAKIIGSNRGAVCEIQFLWPKTDLNISETDLSGQSFFTRGNTYYYKKFYKELKAEISDVYNPHFAAFLVALNPGETAPKVTSSGKPGNMDIEIEFYDGTKDVIKVTREKVDFSRVEADSSN